MQPVGGVRVILPQAVIDEHGQSERVAEPDGRVDDRVVVRPQYLLEPAQHVAPAPIRGTVVQWMYPRRLAPLSKRGRQGRLHHPMLPCARRSPSRP